MSDKQNGGSRSASFIKKYGDLAVELEALPLPVLQEKIRSSIESRLDMDALKYVQTAEAQEREELANLFP